MEPAAPGYPPTDVPHNFQTDSALASGGAHLASGGGNGGYNTASGGANNDYNTDV